MNMFTKFQVDIINLRTPGRRILGAEYFCRALYIVRSHAGHNSMFVSDSGIVEHIYLGLATSFL